MCVCVCVCVRERESVCVCVRERESVCVCVVPEVEYSDYMYIPSCRALARFSLRCMTSFNSSRACCLTATSLLTSSQFCGRDGSDCLIV